MKHVTLMALAASAFCAVAFFGGDRSAEARQSCPGPHQSLAFYEDGAVPAKPRAFYDINVTTPETLRNFLWVIDSTYDLLIDNGTPANKIKFVVSLRGLSVYYASSKFVEEATPEQQAVVGEIGGYIESLLSKGVRIEACQISCDWVGTPAETMLEGIVVIDNAFAASIYYQGQDYALVPVTELP